VLEWILSAGGLQIAVLVVVVSGGAARLGADCQDRGVEGKQIEAKGGKVAGWDWKTIEPITVGSHDGHRRHDHWASQARASLLFAQVDRRRNSKDEFYS
jgi:hypothetical protein